MTLTRREFLAAGAGALCAVAESGCGPRRAGTIGGGFVHEFQAGGHCLRDRCSVPAPAQEVRMPVVIVGGGIAGLSAAWWLDKRGFRDFVLLEMQERAGGNARWDETTETAYPWAAHYVPVPGRRTELVRELLEDLGVLRDGQWDERALCFTPQERLFLHGRWQEGLEPASGLTGRDRDQFRRFEEHMEQMRATGEFTIPIDLGAKPSPLDARSMADWLRTEGFDSPYLGWYVDYACRDDYGARADAVSAWAGIHYFAAREREERGPLTWPEGNGWIVKRLLERIGRFVRPAAVVQRIEPGDRAVRIVAGDTAYRAEAVIFAAPTFVAPYVIDGFPRPQRFEYSPWVTANLWLDRMPRERGLDLAWDNVIYRSSSLGYVNAAHQTLRRHTEGGVWTHYWALAAGAPSDNRAWLQQTDWAYWRDAILDDLAAPHPDIRTCVSRIDVLRLAHAMIRPAVGFMFGEERRRLAEPRGRVFLAHSDLSGISIFEEAQYRGVRAAQGVLRRLGSA